MADSGKHFSLQKYGIKYGREKFYGAGPTGVCTIKNYGCIIYEFRSKLVCFVHTFEKD